MNILEEPCNPYNFRLENNPVQLWSILQGLTRPELERIVIGLAVRDPGLFERKLADIGATRRGYGTITPG